MIDLTQKTPLVLYRGIEAPKPGVLFILREMFIVGGIEVPAGFPTDLGSIPRGARNLAQSTDAPEAFVVHDWNYQTGQVTRAEADNILHEMLKSRVSWFSQKLIYTGVRLGGWVAWNKHRENDPT